MNYHLGDVSDGGTPGQGDNAVGIPDISLIGANYGSALVPDDPVNYLDVGPTDDNSTDGLPLTDNVVNFEDIILFAINYAEVSLTDPHPVGGLDFSSRNAAAGAPLPHPTGWAPGAPLRDATGSVPEAPLPNPTGSAPGDPLADRSEPAPGGMPTVVLVPDPDAAPGTRSYLLQLLGDASLVQGIHAVVETSLPVGAPSDAHHEAFRAEPLGLGEGADVFFGSYEREGSLCVDVVRLGRGRTFPAPGPFARLIAGGREVAIGAAQIPALSEAVLRDSRTVAIAPGTYGSLAHFAGASLSSGHLGMKGDAAGRDGTQSETQSGTQSVTQSGIELLAAYPNPFRSSTEIRFRTAEPGPIRLRLVDVRGRRVTDAVYDFASPGEHSITWDGTNSEGRAVASGLYFVELRSGSSEARGRGSSWAKG